MTGLPPELVQAATAAAPDPTVGFEPDVTGGLAIDPIERIILRDVAERGSRREFERRRAMNLAKGLGGADYNTDRLKAILGKDAIKDPFARQLLADVVDVVDQLGELRRRRNLSAFQVAVPSQLARTISTGLNTLPLGVIPKTPDLTRGFPQDMQAGVAIGKAVGEIIGLVGMGMGTYKLLGRFSHIPKLQPLLARIPHRIGIAIKGGITGSVVEASRPEGVPEDPSMLDIPAQIAQPLMRFGVPEQLALAIGGFPVGAAFDVVLGEAIRGVASGVRSMKINNVANSMTPEGERAIRGMLQDAGVEVGLAASKKDLVRTMLQNQRELVHLAGVAEFVGSADSRAAYQAQFLFDNPQLMSRIDDVEALTIAAYFTAAPRGQTIVRDISSTEAVKQAAEMLGVRINAAKSGDAVLIQRPPIRLPEVSMSKEMQGRLARLRGLIAAEARGKGSAVPVEPVVNIMPDGQTFVGSIDPTDAATALGIRVGAATPQEAIRESLVLAALRQNPDGSAILEIPFGISGKQLQEIVRQVDKIGPERLTILNPRRGKLNVALNNPIGMQVEDAIADMLPSIPRPKATKDMLQRAQQFRRTGVFEGQAGVLPNGYPVRVLRKTKDGIKVQDQLSGTTLTVHPDKLSLLPHSTDGDMAFNKFVLDAMSPTEQKQLAANVRAMNKGISKPIETVADVEQLAAGTRGMLINELEGGKVRVVDLDTGEQIIWNDLKSAGVYVRSRMEQLPDLTPPEITELLGGNPNIGVGGISAPPPKLGERVPYMADIVDPEDIRRVVREIGPQGNIWGQITPSRGHLGDIQRRLLVKGGIHVPVQEAFLDIQEQLIHKQNLLAGLLTGDAPGLPKGVKSLRDIIRTAGRKADQVKMQQWVEAAGDDARRASLARDMTRRELDAVKEFEKWTEAVLPQLGLDPDFVTNQLPFLRKWADQFGNDAANIYARTGRGPVPQGLSSVAKDINHGTIDLNESRLFINAINWASAGGNARFMRAPMQRAEALLSRIPDNSIKGPLASYLEAIRGVEFRDMNRGIDASVQQVFESLGMSRKVAAGIGEKLGVRLLGMGYNATMAFRPGLAMRNMTQTIQTTWAMFGSITQADDLAEAIGRALTTAGRDEAIRAGAIAIKTGGRFAADEAFAHMPRTLRRFTDVGLRLYDGADRWNRAVAYHMVKIRSQRALAKFGDAAQGASPERLRRAQDDLIKDTRAFFFDKPVIEEYLRRAVNQGSDAASEYLGKNASDIAQYLYGRGNQPPWMRTVPGRFLGQYGTWPIWYIDFIRRGLGNALRNGYRQEALGMLGRMATANSAVLALPPLAGISLAKWSPFWSFFYTGGPAVEAVDAYTTFQRGMGSYLLNPDDPQAKSRITEGTNILVRVSRAYIPSFYAIRDLDRLAQATKDPNVTKALAAVLSTRTTNAFELQSLMDALTNPGRLSTDIDLESRQRGRQEMTAAEVDSIRRSLTDRQRARPRLQIPPAPLFGTPPGPGDSAAGQPQTPGVGTGGQSQGPQAPAQTVPPTPGPGPGAGVAPGVQPARPTRFPGESQPIFP